MTELEDLSLASTTETDWSVIADLKKLHTVNQYCEVSALNATSMPALQRLPMLTRLEAMTHMSAAYPLPHLREVDITGSFDDVVKLQAGCYPRVHKVEVSQLVDIASVVQCFPNATSLVYFGRAMMDAAEIIDLSALRALTRLRSLRIHGRKDAKCSFTFLEDLVNLEELRLVDLPIADLSVLRGMKKLRVLWLTRTNVQDVTVLAELHELRDLRLDDTNVRDVSCLRNHQHLKTLLPKGADGSSLLTETGVSLPCAVHICCGWSAIWPPTQ